ncbi:putative poly(A) polymerase-like [Capsicum annuum]|nr:putative poly(A) polymerase-like [Capsicum annuum]
MLYLFLCSLAFSSSLSHLCPKDQALALLQFKHMFTINPNASGYCYEDTSFSWNKSTDCCSWNGVRCDETIGQLIELDLYCSGLQGTFHSNSRLFQLSSLKRLDLSYNNFYGSLISPKFGELSSLTHLDLSGSSFTGLIPAEISHLSKLYVLHLQTHDPYGLRLGAYNFELLLKHLTQLRELDLYSMNISSTIPLNFSSYLTTLWLSRTQLYRVFPERFFHLSNLDYLYLSSNSLTGPISSNVSGLQNLQRLFLSSNYLNRTIPSWIFSIPSLQWLDLSYNSFSGKIQEFKSKTLFYLSLKQNQLEGPILNDNKGTGLELPRVLTTYMITDLSRNRFKGYLLSIIGDLVGLCALNPSHNGLEGVIPASLQHLSVLELLDLSSNKIRGEIPQQLVSLTSLAFLNLSHNHLVGCIPKGKQFDMFENSSYQGNDGLHGLPISKDCVGDDGVPQATTTVELDEEEGDLISWQAVLMGYGCGLVIGLSIIYIMLSTYYPVWFSRMVVKFEHINVTRMKRHKKRY